MELLICLVLFKLSNFRLGLPEEPSQICFRITGKTRPSDEVKENKVRPMASEPDQEHEVIVIDDKDEKEDLKSHKGVQSPKRSQSPWERDPSRSSSRYSREKSREHERDYGHRYKSNEWQRRSRDADRRSRDRDVKSKDRDRKSKERDYTRRDYERRRDYKLSPERRRARDDRGYPQDWKKQSNYRNTFAECYKPPAVLRVVTSKPVYKYEEPEEGVTDDLNVVSVLRLLTALEEKLGSLGPKIIDLLAQALAMEKKEANSSEQLLDSDVNNVLFETVKEKLKGQLLADLVDYSQERAFKNAIKKIANLIHFANERKKAKEMNKPAPEPLKIPGIGTIDKAAIAKQIATSLVVQGKTDVTQEELEQLINAVVCDMVHALVLYFESLRIDWHNKIRLLLASHHVTRVLRCS